MKKNIFSLILLSLFFCSNAQKKIIMSDFNDAWPTIREPVISEDGKYIAYKINYNLQTESKSSLVVQSVDKSWKRDLGNARQPVFSKDNKRIIYRLGKDSVGIFDLTNYNIHFLTDIVDFVIPPKEGNWLIYRQAKPSNIISVLDLTNQSEVKYSNIDYYVVSPVGNALILSKKRESNEYLTLVDLRERKEKRLGLHYKPSNFIFDETGKKVVFFTPSGENGEMDIIYHSNGMDSTLTLVRSSDKCLRGMVITPSNGLMLSSRTVPTFFNFEGDRLFFSITNKTVNKFHEVFNEPNVNIQSVQDDSLILNKKNKPFLVAIDLVPPFRITRLSYERDLTIGEISKRQNSDYILLQSNNFGSRVDYTLDKSATPDLFLINAKTGNRKILKEKGIINSFFFSPKGKYVIWFDMELQHWFSYNMINMSVKKISEGISNLLWKEKNYAGFAPSNGIAGWLENDEAVLIYDDRDIWKVDPDGIKFPLNITNNFGARNNIQLRLLDLDPFNISSFNSNESLILTGFDFSKKQDGFFKLSLRNGKLERLIMSPRVYTARINAQMDGVPRPMLPIRAKKRNLYLLNVMSPTEFPNLYSTSDFKNFQQLTNLAPQEEYNWFTSEPVSWELPNGKLGTGILYKPENFDSSKKYPIIFYYYERNSNALNSYLFPNLTDADLNIPIYTSNGYMVFMPNIVNEIGRSGESAFLTVHSAALHLSKMPWIDVKKMGLQGHSHGGFETNYIVGRTSLFSAAVTAAGISDIISKYNSISEQSYYETGQGRIGLPLWSNPTLYIENSPIFNANKIKTPILIVHGKNDGTVPYSQAEKLFSVLLRLKRKAWLVTYESGDHTFSSYSERLDYSIRMMQFFDHYLKDKPAPKWMTGNYDPIVDGTAAGYDLDINNK
jgi:dipeptidyl aminopeptidase/acylaminoacyl peptidase